MKSVVRPLFGWAVVGLAVTAAFAQEPPPPAKPVELFKTARDLIAVGKFDLAAESLKAFRDSNPADADFLEIERRFGAAVFLRLKNVAKWDDNLAAEADAKKTVNDIIAKSLEVNSRLNRDPARIAKFVRNLGASPAEQAFAVDQLKLGGDAVTPVLLTELRSTNDNTLKTGIIAAVPKLPAATVPGLLAGVEGLPDDQKVLMLQALAQRPDILQLSDKVESNFTPHLWYYSASEAPSVRVAAVGLLDTLTGGRSAKVSADAELIRLTEPLVRHTATFGSLDKVSNKVKVWGWDREKQTVKSDEVAAAAAEEFYGLRNLKWAVERAPQSEAAQSAFLALATERAVVRANYTDLNTKEPAVYRLLAAAPNQQLASLLDVALAENRTALAVGVLQAMGDRGQRDDSTTATGKTTPYGRAINYPDPRVQFAAAVAVLRAPGAAQSVSRAKVVDILQRTLTADLDGLTEGKTGRAIIADPDSSRGAKLAANFQDIGYAAERFTSGRDLLRRIGKSADYNLIVIDRHITNPTFTDVISQIVADPNSGRYPVLLVASSDKLAPVPAEAALARLAMLVAATETEETVVPAPYRFDPRTPDLDREKARGENVKTREVSLETLARVRLKRLQRLVDAADLPTNSALQARLDARLPQLTYAVLAAENAVTPQSAPAIAKKLDEYAGLLRSTTTTEDPFVAVKDTTNLSRITVQLDGSLDADRRKKFEALQQQLPAEALQIEAGAYRNTALEQQLAKQVRGNPRVAVIPETFTSSALADDVKSADPTQQPTSRDEKKAAAKLAAEWLRKIATGTVDGYDAKPAEAAMRTALRSDELAPDIADGLAKLGSGDAQVALVTTATSATRPLAVRFQAADAAIRHVQAFGKQTPAAQVDTVRILAKSEPDLPLQGKLGALANVLAAGPSELSSFIRGFPVTLPAPPVAKPQPMDPNAPAKQPEEPKK